MAKKYKPLQSHVYGLPSNPTNWGDAVEILKAQQAEFGKQRRKKEGVIERLSKIERILEKK